MITAHTQHNSIPTLVERNEYKSTERIDENKRKKAWLAPCSVVSAQAPLQERGGGFHRGNGLNHRRISGRQFCIFCLWIELEINQIVKPPFHILLWLLLQSRMQLPAFHRSFLHDCVPSHS